ncbi:MAG: MotA/TolQ/ExbB proton channel family protein [Planctomycetota bacterium]|nr:MAG: MotA/TolQ/ExbB proton channel family protein [Planctomycetota bacterium]
MVMMPGAPAPEPPPAGMESLYDLVLAGGPLMIPIGICSVVALAFATERWIRLRPAYLGTRAFGRTVVRAVKEQGVSPALELCAKKRSPLARILTAGLRRADAPFLDREKAVEDTAASEVRRLGSNLRPLLLVWLIAPLLGLLGTVWGMIEAFGEIALQEGIGRPDLLAAGIYQALTTTAAGLAVSIPAIVAHHYLKGRIEKFARHSEEFYRELDDHLSGGPNIAAA